MVRAGGNKNGGSVFSFSFSQNRCKVEALVGSKFWERREVALIKNRKFGNTLYFKSKSHLESVFSFGLLRRVRIIRRGELNIKRLSGVLGACRIPMVVLDNRGMRISLKHLFSGIIIGLVLLFAAVFSLPDGKLHIKVYDVGEGDGIFIRSPSGQTVLIDGGPNEKILSLLGGDLPFYQKSIDLLVLTHPHADHLTGLVEVLKKYEVGMVLAEKAFHTTDVYEKFLEILKEKNTKVKAPFAGDYFDLRDGVKFKVVWPRRQADVDYWQGKDLNQTSVVLSVTYGKFSMLFTGDASVPVWDELLRDGLIPYTTVIKVPHQGSSTGIDQKFLAETRPSLAVISLGKNNKYGHPSSKTLELLKEAGIRVLRTDKDGTVEIVSDGKGWEIR